LIVKSLLLLAAVNEYWGEGAGGGVEFDADAAVAVKGTRFACAPSISMVIFNQFHVKRNAQRNSMAALI
jgi:hypothetical protein